MDLSTNILRLTFDQLNAVDQFRLRYAQGKLTYINVQSEPVSTVLFSAYTVAPRIELFRPFRTKGVDYANDDLPVTPTFTISHEEFRAIIDMMGRVAAIRQGDLSGEWVSIMIIPDVRQSAVFEAILNPADTVALIRDIQSVVGKSSSLANQILVEFLLGP